MDFNDYLYTFTFDVEVGEGDNFALTFWAKDKADAEARLAGELAEAGFTDPFTARIASVNKPL